MHRALSAILLFLPLFIFSQNILVLTKKATPNIFERSKMTIHAGESISVLTASKEYSGKLQEISDSSIKINDVWINLRDINAIRAVTIGKILGCILGVPVLIVGGAVVMTGIFAIVTGAYLSLVALIYAESEILKTGLIIFVAGHVSPVLGYGISLFSINKLLHLKKNFDATRNWKIEIARM